MFEPKITKPEDQQALFVLKKSTIDNLDRQTIKHALFASLVALAIILSGTSAALSQQLFRQNDKGIVVLDPGHGGNDVGAQSSDGIQEKTVTLNLARMIANKLEDDFKVVLTRTDDYWLDIPNRTAVTNHLNADLFISLHTGGSFLHSVGGTAIFYFEEHPESAMKEEQPSLNSLTNGDSGPIGWNRIQDRYLTNSRKLAEIMQSQILKITQDPDIRVKGAPLAVLEGADMPAILVEIGYLTNPNEGKALGDQEFLSLIAEAISKGIRKFLSRAF
jgi:N-acetylmuramoyl-L-alanine amidase